jgi:hypothetical protein
MMTSEEIASLPTGAMMYNPETKVYFILVEHGLGGMMGWVQMNYGRNIDSMAILRVRQTPFWHFLTDYRYDIRRVA